MGLKFCIYRASMTTRKKLYLQIFVHMSVHMCILWLYGALAAAQMSQ